MRIIGNREAAFQQAARLLQDYCRERATPCLAVEDILAPCGEDGLERCTRSLATEVHLGEAAWLTNQPMHLDGTGDKPEGSPGESESLAEATWAEFGNFLSPLQWAFDHPSHSPRAHEIASAIKNRGKPGTCTFVREGENGPYKFVVRYLHAWALEEAIRKGRKIYYVSWGQYALLYFDIDLHYAWQTAAEGQRARDMLTALFCRFFGKPGIFWSDSSRGLNGYLKVEIPPGVSPQEANELFARLENAIRRHLASEKNLADFEIKGRVGFVRGKEYAWMQYGKLPIHDPGWNFGKLEEFRATPTVWLGRLSDLCRWIEASVPADVLDRHRGYKKSLGDDPIREGGYFLVTPALEKQLVEQHGEGWRWKFSLFMQRGDSVWLDVSYLGPDGTILSEKERAERIKEPLPVQKATIPLVRTPPPPEKSPRSAGHIKVRVVDDLATEPDSFERQRQALLQLARSLKRVPKLDEALAFLRENRLYSGCWCENLSRRKARVDSILKFIARTFDANKSSSAAKSGHGHVNAGKYDAWAAKKFPQGIVGGKSRWVTPDGEVVAVEQRIQVDPRFIAVFLAICEYALILDKNRDGTLPHDRAEGLWHALLTEGRISVKFCARKRAVCREAMVSYGVVEITDRHYGPNQAMKWALGQFFPFLGLWKGMKSPSLLGPVLLADFLTEREGTRTKGHNTLLRQQSLRVTLLPCSNLPRPPPCRPASLSTVVI
jgi:hypothetical protein